MAAAETSARIPNADRNAGTVTSSSVMSSTALSIGSINNSATASRSRRYAATMCGDFLAAFNELRNWSNASVSGRSVTA